MTTPMLGVTPEGAAQVVLPGKMMLSEMFPGDGYEGLRQAIVANGEYRTGDHGSTLRVKTRRVEGSDDYEVLAMAAIVSRDPGRAEAFLDTVQDYTTTSKTRADQVKLYKSIYANEGLVNNAVNQISAILSGGGSYKVRRAKRGKRPGQPDVLQELLVVWTRNVNSVGPLAVITGSRGLQQVTHQGVRQSLTEGSYMGRTVWGKGVDFGTLGKFDVPTNIQALSTAFIEPVKELVGTGIEAFFWKPSSDFVNQLRRPVSKEVKKLLDQFVPKDVSGPLKKDGKILLDPALLVHIKHRGSDSESFGESFVHPALGAVAYRRSLDQLDLVTMQNLINRLTIIKVGSADPKSPYSKTEVALARQSLMQMLLENPGPNMTIVWAGDDVEVEDVGAFATVLGLDQRHAIGDSKVKGALGVPDALLAGTTSDGKSAGWAALIGVSAKLEELQNAFAQAWTTIGERIALENGFTDVDLVYEFDQSVFGDRMELSNQNRATYLTGGMSIRRFLKTQGVDPDAEFIQKAAEMGLDPADPKVLWKDVFVPPTGLPGQGADGTPQGQGPGKTPGAGKPPANTVTPKPTVAPPSPIKEKKTVQTPKPK